MTEGANTVPVSGIPKLGTHSPDYLRYWIVTPTPCKRFHAEMVSPGKVKSRVMQLHSKTRRRRPWN